MFGYGFLAVVLVLYLAAVGLDPLAVGIVLTLTLIGDTIISLWLTTHADRLGRRRVLVAGAALMILAGIVFAFTSFVPLLILAGAIGVVSPTGNEVGPFLAIEQAALTQTVPDRRRTATFAWYNLVGLRRDRDGRARRRACSARRSSTAGGARRRLSRDRHRLRGDRPRDGDRVLVARAGHRGAAGQGLDRRHPAPVRARAGRKGIVLKLSVLFSLDAFGGGFIPQSLMAYWFHIQYGVDPALLGADLLRGEPAGRRLVAVGGAGSRRGSGCINTMVFTHLPSNVLLILVPLMPNLPARDRGPARSGSRSARWTSRRASPT